MDSRSDSVQIVIFCDQDRCYALVQATISRPPLRVSLDLSHLSDLSQACIAEACSRSAQERIGRALYQQLFPGAAAQLLQTTEADYLILHLDASLFALPWECLYDGTSYLATRFHIGIQLLADEQAADPSEPSTSAALAVLQIHHRPSSSPDSPLGWRASLGYSVSTQLTSMMIGGDVLETAEQFTVLHYIGPFSGGWQLGEGTFGIESLKDSRGRLALVISDFDNASPLSSIAIRNAGRFNPQVPHIICTAPVTATARALFTQTLYGELCHGETVGRAMTVARRRLLSAGLPGGLAYRLLGNAATRIVKFPQGEQGRSSKKTPPAELRQLTVLFSDLVGSTPVSDGLDVEDWDRIQKLYNQTAAQIVNRHGGVVHQYKGDGLVVYFGYPMAYEDAAARAIHAALELVNEMEHGCAEARAMLRACDRAPLKIRVGIHTGPVVVEDISGNATATGLTVAFCERIHRVAPENGVVISSATRALVARHFTLSSLGLQHLKGITHPAECFLVESAHESHNLVLSESAGKLTPFSGRQREMQELCDVWREIRQGRAQTVLVSGEAGIGKSRLLREFRDKTAARDGLVIGCSCSAYFQNNALYPVVEGLRRMMQIDDSLDPGAQFDRLHRFVSNEPDAAHALPAIATLLGIDKDKRTTPLGGTPDQQKTAIIDALITWIQAAAKQQPILLWAEDVHWIDATTLDLLRRLATDLTSSPIMMVLTFRPESGFALTASVVNLRRISLNAISPESARAMIAGTAGSERLRPNHIDQIVERTDGVPLFIEESISMAVDILRARLSTAGGAIAPDLELQIPSTLQGLLTARLDRLGNAKYAAQLGAVIGRTFSLELLEAAAETNKNVLVNQLSALTRTGLLKAHVDDAGTILYSFKHALVRDTAYNSLLTSRRRLMHRKIAEALEQRDYRSRPEGAELLAHHYAQSGQFPQAIDCWMLAAQRATKNAAQREAIGHLEQVLQAIRKSRPEQTDPKIELRAELMRAACLTAVAGYSASVAGDAFKRAEQLALEHHDPDALLRARFGIEAFYLMRADFNRALEVAQDCKRMSEASVRGADSGMVQNRRQHLQIVASAVSDWTIGNVLFHQAKFDLAIPYMDRSIERCTNVANADRRQVQDPAVMCWIYKGWHAWEAGYPDRALEYVETGIATAYRGGHPFGIGVALAFKACIRLFRREYALAIDAARHSIEYSAEPSFRIWWAWARVLLGRGLSDQESTRAEGIHEIQEGLRLWDESEAIVTRPFNLALLAEAYHADGRTAEALDLLANADQTIQRHGERYYEPEVKRLQGVMRASLAEDEHDRWVACRFLDEAAAIAHRQGMPSSELRALCDRVRLDPAHSSTLSSWHRLTQLVAGFTEGHETADVRAARALLEDRQSPASRDRDNPFDRNVSSNHH